jgi:diketogulonate reductase-like aldo/keto reductase
MMLKTATKVEVDPINQLLTSSSQDDDLSKERTLLEWYPDRPLLVRCLMDILHRPRSPKRIFMMPQLCFGTVQANLETTLPMAIKIGYRHFDGADGYAHNDVNYLKILRENLARLPRDEYWLTWKSNDITLDNIQRVLKELDCGYIDLFLKHHGCGVAEEFDVLQEAVNFGLIRYYGVSNCEDIKQLKKLKAKYPLYANQVQARPPHGEVDGRKKINFQKFVLQCNALGIRIMLFASVSGLMMAPQGYIMVDRINRVNHYYIQKYILTVPPTENVLIVSSIRGSSLLVNYQEFERFERKQQQQKQQMMELQRALSAVKLHHM